MGDKNQEKKDMEHKQKHAAKEKKFSEAVRRQVKFEIDRTDIKAKVEVDRQFAIVATITFLVGLFLLISLLAYGLGVILYG